MIVSVVHQSSVRCPSSAFSKDFSSETTGSVSLIFHMQPTGKGEMKVLYLFQVTGPNWPACPYMVKTFFPEPLDRLP